MFFSGDFFAGFRAKVMITVTVMLALNQESLPFRSDFAIAGTHCFLSTNSVDVLEFAAQWRCAWKNRFASEAAQSFGKPSGSSSFEMKILVDSSLGTTPQLSMHFRGLRHLVFASLPPSSFIAYDLLRRRVHAALSCDASRDHSFWNKLLLPITIGVLGTTVGVAPLHCACLERGGIGLLLAGASGAGKSTLSFALAQIGFALISDDWTYISKGKSGLIAHGLAAPVKLLSDTVRFFPYLHDLAPRTSLNGELAYEIDPAQYLGCTVKRFSHPRQILFLERTATPGCDFLPARPEYVTSFFENGVERLPDELSEAKRFRAGVIRALSTCPAWVLRTGESPQRTAEAIDHFLLEQTHAFA
jgi:hypothetical protein